MNNILSILTQTLQHWIAEISTLAGGLQFGIAIFCAGLALITNHQWRVYINKRLGSEEKKGILRAIIRGTLRIAFPISMLIYVLIGSEILSELKFNTAILDVLTPLLLSMAAIRTIVYILRRGFSPSAALRAWEGVISTMVWSIVALYLLGWLPGIMEALDSAAVTFSGTRFSLLSLIKLVIFASVLVVAANWISGVVETKTNQSKYFTPSMQVGLVKFSKFFLYTIAVLLALNSVGIDFTTLTVFGGALGVGIGFGLQRIASNFISGFILLFDRSIRPGDVISIGDRFGWVQELRARYVVVRDRDGVETLIPNENLVTSEVTNWSYSDRHVRIKIPIQISYKDDPELALALMVACSKTVERVLSDPAPQGRLIGFGEHGLNLELRFWLRDPEAGIRNVRSEINLMIWKKFKQEGIVIPYPQRDVHVFENKPKDNAKGDT